MWVPTTGWGLLQHRWWHCQAQESCKVPDRVCHLCSLLLACQILIYHHSSHRQACRICHHKWCPGDPCLHQTGSEYLCPSLLVALLSTDIPLWYPMAWTTEKGGISEMGGQGLGAHLSTEVGGRSRLNNGPEGSIVIIINNNAEPLWETLRNIGTSGSTTTAVNILEMQKLFFFFLYHQIRLFLVSNKQWKTRHVFWMWSALLQVHQRRRSLL